MKYYNKKKKKQEGWYVKNIRPEDILEHPSEYYTLEEIENYSHSGGMRRAQELIAFRVIELLELRKRKKILDVGCGVGYTMNVFLSEGYNVNGVDLMQGMVDKATKNGFKVKQGDMRELNKIVKKESYDALVSISALQWIKTQEDLKKVAKSFYFCLKKGGKLIIQYYPKNKQELLDTLKVFQNNKFSGRELIENEDDPRRRLVFLVLEKNN